MNLRATKAVLCLTTALSAFSAAPALAQDVSGQSSLDEIVVTARRIDERLQDVPISITVFNQEQLNSRNVLSGADLATYTPSLSANGRFGNNNTTFAIRGFTQELRTTASVAVYFADVVAPRGGNGGQPAGDGAGPGAFFDLQNVQVLKGPQGTLFGRNTTGGAVLLVPQKPTHEFEGYLEGSYGNYDMQRLQGVVNLPLGETARLRLGFDRQTRDGYVKNISGIGPSRFGDLEYTALRASFVAELTPDLENYTIGTYARSQDHAPIGKLTAYATTPANGPVLADCSNAAFPFGLLACQQMGRQADAGFFTVQNARTNPKARTEQWQLINTTTWHASDALTVKNIISYSQLKSLVRGDTFGATFVIPTSFGPIPNTGALAGSIVGFAQSNNIPGRNGSEQDTFTEELQVQGRTSGDQLTWQAGAYYEESNPLTGSGAQSPILLSCTDIASFQCTDVMAQLLRRPSVGSLTYAIGEVSFHNLGLYGQATYKLTDTLKLTGGLRYTWDRTTATAEQVTYRFFTPNVLTGVCTLATNIAATSPAQCSSTSKQKSDAPTWVVGLDYNPMQDVLLYGKYSRGYRQGAVNFFAPAQFQTFGPEKVDTYEVGAKASFHGAVSGSFNVAAFYNDFTNQQLAVGLLSSTNAAPPTQAIINGGKSRIYGFETDGMLRLPRGFSVDGSYAYLNTKLQSLTPVAIPPGSSYDTFQFAATPGSPLPFTPKHKASVTGTYRLPLSDEIGQVSVSATYSYASSYLVTSGPYGTLPSVELVNLNMDWKSIAGRPIDLALFATNVTNEKYYLGVNDQRTSGFVSQLMASPRMYGMRLRYRFGG
ncbi:TonB-dependent receptor [Phenylobacterium sp. LjRoot225]|uniref:TonB-dependent receptor n=1 Tax=Phenylobacterium sp. LjRoot225 TaxID=3342285 RepID=UPI003ED0C4D3